MLTWMTYKLGKQSNHNSQLQKKNISQEATENSNFKTRKLPRGGKGSFIRIIFLSLCFECMVVGWGERELLDDETKQGLGWRPGKM